MHVRCLGIPIYKDSSIDETGMPSNSATPSAQPPLGRQVDWLTIRRVVRHRNDWPNPEFICLRVQRASEWSSFSKAMGPSHPKARLHLPPTIHQAAVPDTVAQASSALLRPNLPALQPAAHKNPPRIESELPPSSTSQCFRWLRPAGAWTMMRRARPRAPSGGA